jgi:plasmid maintenance system antidote protein VapI
MVNKKILSEDEMLSLLQERVDQVGSQVIVSQESGVSRQYINDMLHRNRPISEKMAIYLGYSKQKTVQFVKMEVTA